MKTMIAGLALLVCLGTSAQEKKERHDRPELTSEQKRNLKVKELTLALNLSDKQQKEIAPLIDEQIAQRTAIREQMKSRKTSASKPTADEIYNQKSQMLDRKIAEKQKFRKILNDEQFAKWEKQQAAKRHEFRKERHGSKNKRPHKPGTESQEKE